MKRPRIAQHHYETARWAIDFSLIPLHFLSFVHMYAAAMWSGALAIIAFGAVAFLSAPRPPVAVETSDEDRENPDYEQ